MWSNHNFPYFNGGKQDEALSHEKDLETCTSLSEEIKFSSMWKQFLKLASSTRSDFTYKVDSPSYQTQNKPCTSNIQIRVCPMLVERGYRVHACNSLSSFRMIHFCKKKLKWIFVKSCKISYYFKMKKFSVQKNSIH